MPIDRNNGAILALGAAGALAAIGAVAGRRRGSRHHGPGIVGNIGDVDPIQYGGGVVFEDEDGGYTLEYVYGADSDEDYGWEQNPDYEHVVYRVGLESDLDSFLRWNDWADLDAVADSVGATKDELLERARKGGAVGRAWLANEIAAHYGWQNLDEYPVKITERDLVKRWKLD